MSSELIHERMERAAAAAPDRTAIVDGERTVSYGELDERAGRIADLLAGLGVAGGDRVGLCLEKSIEALVGIYAVLKAGAVYVPLDPRAPAARLAYIAGDCGLCCLLSSTEQQALWEELREAGAAPDSIVALDAVLGESAALAAPADMHVVADPAALAHGRVPAPRPRRSGDDLAYILYTSGSTGEPKGVMLSHRNALAFVDWAVDRFGVLADDRLSSHAPLHFDLSIFDLYAAATAGSTLVLVPAEASVFPAQLARLIADMEISIWYSVPSILAMLTLRGGLASTALPHLRTVLFAGEVFPTKHLRRLMSLIPDARFVNLYGPTETNVCTFYEVPALEEDRDEAIPIGRAIDGVRTLVVAEAGVPAAEGEVGELYVAGPTVMGGYWNDAARSARALVPDPRGGAGVMYRTGDLVRERGDGELLFLGRRDNQVKSRGYRIELAEVERALDAHGEIVECAVVAVPDELVTNRLTAFVAARGDVDAAALSRFCAERIPRYMVPEAFELRDTLPKTSTGKIDRQRLLDAARAGTEGTQ